MKMVDFTRSATSQSHYQPKNSATIVLLGGHALHSEEEEEETHFLPKPTTHTWLFLSLFSKSSDNKQMATRKIKTNIKVHPLTKDPYKAWQKLQLKQKVLPVTPLDLATPIYEDKVRFVCLSDTHSRHGKIKVPPGDVLLHAGDFTQLGAFKEVYQFNEFLGALPHRHKVVIAGNHELTFDPLTKKEVAAKSGMFGKKANETETFDHVKDPRELLTNCIYLEDSEISICGIKIYGSPWQPAFCSWAFNLPRGYPCLDQWNLIPEDTDILMTHGPPIGHGDECQNGMRAGCVELLHTVQQRVQPKYHLFGHIHESYGVTTDGFTTYINASNCTLRYRPDNPPVIFDMPLPPGFTKDDLNVTSAAKTEPNKTTDCETDVTCGDNEVDEIGNSLSESKLEGRESS